MHQVSFNVSRFKFISFRGVGEYAAAMTMHDLSSYITKIRIRKAAKLGTDGVQHFPNMATIVPDNRQAQYRHMM